MKCVISGKHFSSAGASTGFIFYIIDAAAATDAIFAVNGLKFSANGFRAWTLKEASFYGCPDIVTITIIGCWA